MTLDDSRPESMDQVSRRLLDPFRDQGNWIPACAGMTLKLESTMAGSAMTGMALVNEFYAAYHSHWIPACAGMTWGAGMTGVAVSHNIATCAECLAAMAFALTAVDRSQ